MGLCLSTGNECFLTAKSCFSHLKKKCFHSLTGSLLESTNVLYESSLSTETQSPFLPPQPPTPSASAPLTFSHPPHFVDVKLPDLRDLAAMHKTCYMVLALLFRASHVFL